MLKNQIKSHQQRIKMEQRTWTEKFHSKGKSQKLINWVKVVGQMRTVYRSQKLLESKLTVTLILKTGFDPRSSFRIWSSKIISIQLNSGWSVYRGKFKVNGPKKPKLTVKLTDWVNDRPVFDVVFVCRQPCLRLRTVSFDLYWPITLILRPWVMAVQFWPGPFM